MTFPDDYWSSYEHQVGSLEDFLEAVRTISAYQSATKTRFIWRGVKDASWGLHSRLFRAYRDAKGGTTPNERQLRAFEEGVIEEAREWWETFTDEVIRVIVAKTDHVVFILWGGEARRKKALIEASRHTFIESPHPSPQSAYRSFFGSKPFSRANYALIAAGREGIDWSLTE
jgi:hypothetical protein